jgi:hypothetical protein
MPGLVTPRSHHACCAVRGKLVDLGGNTPGGGVTSSVEMVSSTEEGAFFVDLPPLSCGAIGGAAAIAVEESDSAAGQVLLLGGAMQGVGVVSTVRLVDLATSVCTPGRPDMLRSRCYFAAAGLLGGGIVCAGGYSSDNQSAAEMWGPPVQGALDAAWTWRHLPAMSVARYGCSGCVMSDGRFDVLVRGVGDRRRRRALGASAAHARSTGLLFLRGCCGMRHRRRGVGRNSAEVFDEVRGRWLRLPRGLPHNLGEMGSALL